MSTPQQSKAANAQVAEVYRALLQCYARSTFATGVRGIPTMMREAGWTPTPGLYILAVKECGAMGRLELAEVC